MKFLKKSLSILLALLFIFSACSGLVASAANSSTPIVYIIGRTGIFTESGNLAIIEDPSFITNVVTECIPYLKDALLKNQWDAYCDKLYDLVSVKYADYKLNNDGEVVNGSHINWGWNYNSLPSGQNDNDIYTYKFEYDARRDPCDIADDLHDYIQAIKTKTGHSKIHLISRCLGCNIACAYLAEYGWSDIKTNIMFASAAAGYDFVGEMFAGKFAFDASAINRYEEETFYQDNEAMTELCKATIALADNLGLLDIATFGAELIYKKVYENVVPRLVISTYGTCPGYWSMVNDENYEDAKKFIFADEANTTYKKIVEKIDNYHYNVQNNIEDMLLKMKADGCKMGIICKYGFQVTPFIESSDKVGDNRIDVTKQSFGAVTAKMGKTFSPIYMKRAQLSGTAKYISPDKQIDSSTALFPDYTWYIKNVVHNPFHDCFNPLMFAMCRSEEQMTIDTYEEYPQYLFYNPANSTCTPLTEENMNTYTYTTNIFSAIIRFFKALNEYLKFLIQSK